MRILITEVTEMHHANYCVAGWCAATGQMVRPLPNGANWTAQLLAAKSITPGATVEITASGAQPNGAYPHLTEDLPIDLATINLVNLGPATWFGSNAPPTAATLSEAFENHIQNNSVWNGNRQGVHVQSGTQCRSLWAVRAERDAITFVEDFDRLKAVLDDDTASYKLAVSGRVLKETWRESGTQAINQLIAAATRLHVRVGLARAFEAQANKCFVMINGLNW